MHSTVTQFTKCLFQELWRQFLEEKEGPSEAAAAAPVQVFTLMKMSLLGLDIGYWVLGIGHWEAMFKIKKFAKKNLCVMKMASQCPLKKIYLRPHLGAKGTRNLMQCPRAPMVFILYLCRYLNIVSLSRVERVPFKGRRHHH